MTIACYTTYELVLKASAGEEAHAGAGLQRLGLRTRRGTRAVPQPSPLCGAQDFAADGDEGRLRKAAHLMVSSLAGSLSLVTAKDPLRLSLTSQLRQMLQSQVADAAMLDSIIRCAGRRARRRSTRTAASRRHACLYCTCGPSSQRHLRGATHTSAPSSCPPPACS